MSKLHVLCLFIANALIPIAVYVFAIGFFPYKPFLPGLASFQDQDAAEEMQLLRSVSRPAPVFDKVFFMVVDALRSDFVYGESSGFHFTQNLITNGLAIPFTAHAAPPTVTMPRVKALTTGSVPTFVDFILNFAESDTTSSLATQDTWLAQLREHLFANSSDAARRGSIDFYGDDTWLKLFPAFFTRHDGTTSFFVSDFYEVDDNVTRHLPSILESKEWDGTIVHYLGLDHIGHKTGPEGAHMYSKQLEMDGIIQQIYTAMETRPHLADTVLVLAGDHGMNNGGNHGGSSDGETSTALVFVSPKFKGFDRTRAMSELDKQSYQARGPARAPTAPRNGTAFEYFSHVSQSDLVPTLSGLLGLPVPRNSLGVFIPELLSLWYDDDDKSLENPGVQLLYRNALQMLQIVQATYGREEFEQVVGMTKELKPCSRRFFGEQKLRCLWGRAQRLLLATGIDGRVEVDEQCQALREFLVASRDILGQTASQYNVRRLVGGIAIALCAIVFAWSSVPSSLVSSIPTGFFGFMTLTYGIMMLSSSYVEEEQRYWYWTTSAWITIVGLQSFSRTQYHLATLVTSMSLLGLHRITIRWNQTGQKFSGARDISRSFFPSHHLVLWTLIVLTYANSFQRLVRTTLKSVVTTELAVPLAAMVVVPAFVFKLNFAEADAPELVKGFGAGLRAWSSQWDLVTQARLVFASSAAIGVLVVVHGFTSRRQRATGNARGIGWSLYHLLTVILVTQTRVNNVPLFLIFEIQQTLLAWLLQDSFPGWLRQFSSRMARSAPSAISRNETPLDTTASKIRSSTMISVSTVLFAMTTYFCTGGSNAISSIDLSNAYNGISSYNAGAVGLLLFVGNWAGPISWSCACVLLLGESRRHPKPSSTEHVKPVADSGSAGNWTWHVAFLTLFTVSSLFFVMLSCTILRTHLFIWTVFSPKFLYAMAWTLAWHFGVNVVVGGLLYALSRV